MPHQGVLPDDAVYNLTSHVEVICLLFTFCRRRGSTLDRKLSKSHKLFITLYNLSIIDNYPELDHSASQDNDCCHVVSTRDGELDNLHVDDGVTGITTY